MQSARSRVNWVPGGVERGEVNAAEDCRTPKCLAGSGGAIREFGQRQLDFSSDSYWFARGLGMIGQRFWPRPDGLEPGCCK